MKAVFSAIALAGGLIVLSGCGGRDEPSEAPTATATTEQPGMDSPADVGPVNAQTWLDDFTIGSEVDAEGKMVTGKTGDDFAPGQKVHLTMEAGDAPAETPVKVVWYGPNETKVGEETKTVNGGQKYLHFSADTASWPKGDYRAEVWVGDEKVNQQMFNITDADKATS